MSSNPAIIRLNGEHAAPYTQLRREQLAEHPTFWHSGCAVEINRTHERTVMVLERDAASDNAVILGFEINGAIEGTSFAFARPTKNDWLLGGTYIRPAWRGPLAALGGERVVDKFYDARIQFITANAPGAVVTTMIRRNNVVSAKVAKRHGFKCITARRNVPNMSGGTGDVLYFRRTLGS